MALEDVRRSENFCPSCNELGITPENVTGVRICNNDSCIVKTYATDSIDYSIRELQVQDMPECPSCGARGKLDKHDTIRCVNPDCRIDKLEYNTYIKIRD